MVKNHNKKLPKKPLSNSYAKYSMMGFQMAATIGLGVWGGISLDNYLQLKFPVFKIALSLIGVFVGIYIAVKDLLKKK